MKILHILPPSNLGPIDNNFHTNGLVKSVWLLDKFLTKKGHKSYIAWSKNSKINGNLIPIIDNLNIENIRNPKIEIFNNYYKKILDLVNNSDFDIIHNHISRPLFYNKYRPNVLTLRLPIDYLKESPERINQFIGESLPRHIYTVALTTQQANAYEFNGYNINQIVPNGIDPEEFSITNNIKRRYLCIIGRIMPEKGQHLAIEVAQKSGAPLIIAGDIWDQKYFNDKIEPYIDDGFIKYLGPIDSKTKINIYQSAKALLMPIQWEEPFSMSVLESLVCGTPVVAFRHGMMSEIIIDNKTGFVVDTPEEMVSAIKKLNSIDRKFCRKYVSENFNIEKIVDAYINIYEKLIAKKKIYSFFYPLLKFIN